MIFASIQTLGRINHLRQFEPDTFDYIIVDEFHHAAARSYRKLIEYFDPRFLLGLTATPERTDGGNLLAFAERILSTGATWSRASADGCSRPFHYFGVPDEVDYANIPWRSGRFDAEALTQESPPRNGHKTPSSNTTNGQENERSPSAAPSCTLISWRISSRKKAFAPPPFTRAEGPLREPDPLSGFATASST